ncbi:MAG: circadian clock KaiB family protein [Deltaproteobacteria bacterium]|nr:circadian clock KaiB family protein [Deltaproteobacteria bacterium]MBW2015572.1 circadian clock KaiB family protein [Deltaproteobacteria bacterium]MBW2127892.1 circadian clock KaiB family protein [Deltaproteobacteria bacterium]MBW2305272.1 circadian clock KaiB family protein [Deltaproteobacteria bacterium]
MEGGKKQGKGSGEPFFRFRLFVAGDEPNSRKARAVLKRFCENRLKGRYKIEIIDVLKDYQAALKNNILAVPTLIVVEPEPAVTIIGSLNDEHGLLAALGMEPPEEQP